MKTRNLLLVLLAITFVMACNQQTTIDQSENQQTHEISQEDQDLLAKAQALFKPLPQIAENKNNPITPEKVALGKTLYYDKRLSKDENVSCNSCHDLETYGVGVRVFDFFFRHVGPGGRSMDCL